MAHVRVGTRRFNGSGVAAPDDPTAAEVGVKWVEIGGVRLDVGKMGIKSVAYESDGQPSKVTVTFFCTSFSTVNADE